MLISIHKKNLPQSGCDGAYLQSQHSEAETEELQIHALPGQLSDLVRTVSKSKIKKTGVQLSVKVLGLILRTEKSVFASLLTVSY